MLEFCIKFHDEIHSLCVGELSDSIVCVFGLDEQTEHTG